MKRATKIRYGRCHFIKYRDKADKPINKVWTFDWLLTDVDECTSNVHNCHQQGICTNNIGSFSCQCKKGYTGNGTWCTGELQAPSTFIRFGLKRIFFNPVWPIVHAYPVKTVTENGSFPNRSPDWRFLKTPSFCLRMNERKQRF